MRVKYQISGYLKGVEKKTGYCVVPDGARIKNLFKLIGVEGSSPVLVFQNGNRKNLNSELHENDEISLIPIVGGG